jgi:hypothetical protein
MFDFFKRREPAMAENPNPGTGAGSPPAFDPNQFAESLTRTFTASLAEALKPINDRLAKFETAPAPEAKTDGKAAGRNLTAEDVGKIVNDALANHRASESKRAARAAFADEKMKDLPRIYRDQLPETDDVNQLQLAEQRIRSQYQTDFKAAGGAEEDAAGAAGGQSVGGANPGGAGPIQNVDLSKLNASQLIYMGLRRSRPARSGGTNGAPLPSERAKAAAASAKGN